MNSSPNAFDATAPWAPVQKGHSFALDTKASKLCIAVMHDNYSPVYQLFSFEHPGLNFHPAIRPVGLIVIKNIRCSVAPRSCPLSSFNKSVTPRMSLRAKRSNLFGFNALTPRSFHQIASSFYSSQ